MYFSEKKKKCMGQAASSQLLVSVNTDDAVRCPVDENVISITTGALRMRCILIFAILKHSGTPLTLNFYLNCLSKMQMLKAFVIANRG